MNNFPENENNLEQEELSTVFSNPEQHKTVNQKNGNKKRLKIIVAAFSAIVILVSGTFAAIKFIPEKTDDTTDTSIEEIEVLKMDESDYKTVKVKNENGDFKFYTEIIKAESEDDADTVNWYLEGYDKSVTSSSGISYTLNNLCEISALREITEKSLEDCGLANPKIKADIETNDGEQFSILVGSKSPDNAGIYIKLSTKDNIYLTTNSLDESLTFEALDFANTDAIAGIELDSSYSDYINDGKLADFDSVTVSGKNFKNSIVIKPNSDENTNSLIAYKVYSPQERNADGVDKLIALFADGITVSGAYSFDVSANTLSKFGLNNPDLSFTVKIKDYSYTYKFALQSDGNYAVVTSDSLLVKKISADTLELLNYTESDFYANWVFIDSIDRMSNLTVQLGDKVYSMDIAKNPDEEDTENKYIVTYNGENLNSSNFQDFYRFCVSISCTDYNVEDLDAAESGSITYTYSDTSNKPVKIGFKKVTATKYQYSINGKDMGKVNASDFNRIDKYLQQLLSGEKVTYN